MKKKIIIDTSTFVNANSENTPGFINSLVDSLSSQYSDLEIIVLRPMINVKEIPYKEFNITQCEFTLPDNKFTKFIVIFNQNKCYDFYFESQETNKESFINNVTTLLEHLNFC